MPVNVSDEDLVQAVDALKAAGGVKAQAAEKLGLPITTFKHRLSMATRRGLNPEQGLHFLYPDGFKMGKVTVQRGADGTVERTWERVTEDTERQFELAQAMIEEMAADVPRVKPTAMPNLKIRDELMVACPWGDPHFGMYSWAEETGADFDLDIAKRDLCGAVGYLVRATPPASRFLIVNLGDFFHADNLEGVTPAHRNILDMDSRLPKVVQIGVSAMRTAISSALKRHETVEMINAVGNHDPVLSFVMSILLANVYENEPRVKIHDQPTFRHYVRHGKVLIGVTHGDKTKDTQLPGIMATERAVDWGETRHRYFWRGHHHQDTRQEYNGCIVEQFRTLAAGDSYAVSRGFLSGRDMKAIVLHKEYGEVARHTCSLDLLRQLGK